MAKKFSNKTQIQTFLIVTEWVTCSIIFANKLVDLFEAKTQSQHNYNFDHMFGLVDDQRPKCLLIDFYKIYYFFFYMKAFMLF
jgi:hypothetical protein